MKRSFKRPRKRKVKIPKPILPEKPHRPKRSELKKIYKELLTSSQEQKVNTFAKALHWFDKVQVYLAYKNKGKWTTKQLRNKNAMEKSRAESIQSKNVEVKEVALQKSIVNYEQMVASYKPPSLQSFLKKYTKARKKLAASHEKVQDKHAKFIAMLQEAVQPINADGKVVKLEVAKIDSDYLVTEKKIVFDKHFILEQRKLVRKQGLLASVIVLLPVLARPAALIPQMDNRMHPTGKYTRDVNLFVQEVLRLIENFKNYCMREDAPRTIVRRMKPRKES